MKKVADSASNPSPGSSCQRENCIRYFQTLSISLWPEPESRDWCHCFVNHGEKTSSKHWALLSLSECEIQSNGWMLVAVALCLAAYTVSDSHQSEQQLRSQALGSCLLRAKEDPFRAPVSDQWQQVPGRSRPMRGLVSELSAISVLETWTPEPGPGRCLHGVRAPRHEGAALLCSGSHQ